MKSPQVLTITVCLALLPACLQSAEPSPNVVATSLVGQLVLPPGEGSRGVEILVDTHTTEPQVDWVLFDDEGGFTHTLNGTFVSLTVSSGIGGEIEYVKAAEAPEPDSAGRIDFGEIDIRDQLTRHRLKVTGNVDTVVRVGMWFKKPPQGVALGSRQFPPLAIGAEQEWLLPKKAQAFYFLVECPADDRRGREWRGGRQQLFGPYERGQVPTELVMD